MRSIPDQGSESDLLYQYAGAGVLLRCVVCLKDIHKYTCKDDRTLDISHCLVMGKIQQLTNEYEWVLFLEFISKNDFDFDGIANRALSHDHIISFWLISSITLTPIQSL